MIIAKGSYQSKVKVSLENSTPQDLKNISTLTPEKVDEMANNG